MQYSKLTLLLLITLCVFPHPLVADESEGGKPKEDNFYQLDVDREEFEDNVLNTRLEMAIKNLGASESFLVEKAMYRLMNYKEKALPMVAKIVKARKAPQRQKVNALYLLGRIGNDSKKYLPAIIVALKNDDVDVSSSAAIALGKIGSDRYNTVTYLAQYMKKQRGWPQDMAIRALKQINTKESWIVLRDYLAEIEVQANSEKRLQRGLM